MMLLDVRYILSNWRGQKPSRERERGQSLVEFAIILPVFLLILFAILDFGRAVYAYHVVANAAREGARFGQISPEDTAGIIAKAENAAVGLDVTDLDITVTWPTTDTVRVDVGYTFRLITPLVSDVVGSGLSLDGTSTMYTGW